jgi:hypothetical protein
MVMDAATIASVPRRPHVSKLVRFPPAVAALLAKMAAADDRTETNFLVRLVREEAMRRGIAQSEDGRERP